MIAVQQRLLTVVETKFLSLSVSGWQADDVIVEAESSISASEGEEDAEVAGDSENDIRQLKARRHVLTNKLAQQQKRRDKIQVKWAYTYVPNDKCLNLEINCNDCGHLSICLTFYRLNNQKFKDQKSMRRNDGYFQP